MRQFIYRIRPTRAEAFATGFTKEESSIVSDHFNYLQKLTREGVVQLAGKTPNEPGKGFGIIIFRAESESAARRIVDEDPAIKNKVFEAELFPFRTSLFNGSEWAAP